MMKRANTWRDVEDFDFGNEEDDDEFRKIDVYATTTKRNRKPGQDNVGAEKSNGAKTTTGKRRKFQNDTLDWIARHRPTAPSQLAVNQKKVEEFAEWARGKQVRWVCF